MTEDSVSKPRTIPAATLVIFRKAVAGGPAELLMLERSGEMRFAGGAAVFPGGRIDPADHELGARLAPHLEADEAAARVAALRETLEETGLALMPGCRIDAAEAFEARALLLESGVLGTVLERFDWAPDLDQLVLWARWCPNWEGAFDTRFYLADLGTGAVQVAVDATENAHLFWASAAEALAMADRGEIRVIFPTRRNLERLAQFETFAEARVHAGEFPVTAIAPRRVEREGVKYLTIPEGLGYPVTAQRMDTVKRG